jgi:hypothetical protein
MPWPPPLDDREVWSGEIPGTQECREFGWLVTPDAGLPNAERLPDLDRLHLEAEWSRTEKRFIRTNLTAAFVKMRREGILISRGWDINKKTALSKLNMVGTELLRQGKKVAGYVYYTAGSRIKKQQGRNFPLHFGSVDLPQFKVDTPSAIEVGKLVCECLSHQRVRYEWDGHPESSIYVVTASIRPFHGPLRDLEDMGIDKSAKSGSPTLTL